MTRIPFLREDEYLSLKYFLELYSHILKHSPDTDSS